MDWTNHIIASHPCRKEAGEFVSYATESFLTTLGNKGLYKRAQKDLEAVASDIRIESGKDGAVQVSWDDVSVCLQVNVRQSTCSCPSKTVCKHLLMALLATAAYATSGESADEEETPHAAEPDTPREESAEAWQELQKLDMATLRKQAGKKLFDDTLHLIQTGWTAEITEGEMLEAVINTENITVYFPKQRSVEGAVCKCGSDGLCRHKLIAILSYLSRREQTASLDVTSGVSILTDAATELIANARTFVLHLLRKGLVHAGENESDTAAQYAIHFETCGIGNLSRLFRSLSTDLDRMRMKHVGFSRQQTYANLCRLYNTLRLQIANRNDAAKLKMLIEPSRSEYYTVPLGHFTALGCYPWRTRSGYAGLTAFFFHTEKQTVCTYTSGMADFYEQTAQLANMEHLTKLYRSEISWVGGSSPATLSKSTFTLRNFKLNSQNRLSASSQTQCECSGTIITGDDLEQLASLPAFKNDNEPRDAASLYFGKRTPPGLLIVSACRIARIAYDRTRQDLRLTAEDAEGQTTEMSIPYHDLSSSGIARIEEFARLGSQDLRSFICLLTPASLPMPIALVTQTGIRNFFFE